MKKIDVKQAKESLAEYSRHVAEEPVVVTDNGKPVAALVSLGNTDMETVSLSTNADFMGIIERSRSRAKREGTLSEEEIRQKLDSSD